MTTKLDAKTVDRTMDEVTVMLDAMTVDSTPPNWDIASAGEARNAFELVDSLDMDQQVAFLRHCALRIRSSIIRREVEQEIADERKALGDDFYRPRVTA
jgi:hypothetical protein